MPVWHIQRGGGITGSALACLVHSHPTPWIGQMVPFRSLVQASSTLRNMHFVWKVHSWVPCVKLNQPVLQPSNLALRALHAQTFITQNRHQVACDAIDRRASLLQCAFIIMLSCLDEFQAENLHVLAECGHQPQRFRHLPPDPGPVDHPELVNVSGATNSRMHACTCAVLHHFHAMIL